MSECRGYLVSGRVQGVFFRASARAEAQRLGVTGWVCNRPDGCVEVLACGEAQALDALQEWLWQGPSEARVTGIEPFEVDASPSDFTDFGIR